MEIRECECGSGKLFVEMMESVECGDDRDTYMAYCPDCLNHTAYADGGTYAGSLDAWNSGKILKKGE